MATEKQPVSAEQIGAIKVDIASLKQHWASHPGDVPLNISRYFEHGDMLLQALTERDATIDKLQTKCALTAAASLLVEAQHLEQLAAELRRRVDEAARGEDGAEVAVDLSAKCERLEQRIANQAHIITSQTDHELHQKRRMEQLEAAITKADARLQDLGLDQTAIVRQLLSSALDGGEDQPINERIEFALQQGRRWNDTASRLLLERQAAGGPNGECPICGGIECKPGCRDGSEVL